MQKLLSKTIRALSLTTLSLALTAAAATTTNYVSFSSLPASTVISNVDGMTFYWKSNGLFYVRRVAWSDLASQLSSMSNGYANAVAPTNFDAQFARDAGTGTVLNAATAINTNQVGIWLIHTNGTKGFFGTNLLAAYNAEVSSDTLYMDDGVYYAPAGGLTIANPGTHWVGQSCGLWNQTITNIFGGAVISNSIVLTTSNCVFENFAVVANDLPFDTRIQSTNPANNKFVRLITGCTLLAGSAHNMYITGNGNLVDGCESYDNANHGILAIGCANTLIKNCVAKFNGANSFVVKADPQQYGSVSNVCLLNNFGDSDILIQSVTNNNLTAYMRHVTLDGNHLDNSGNPTHTEVIWIGMSPGCEITDLKIDHNSLRDISGIASPSLAVIYQTASGCLLTNLSLRNNIFDSPGQFANALLAAADVDDVSQISCYHNMLNGYLQNGSGFNQSVRLYSAAPSNLSGSKQQAVVTPNTIAAIRATNGSIYFYFTGFATLTNYMLAGDPIWVSNSASLCRGVYRYQSCGVQSGNVPVFGGPNGDTYVQCEFGGTNIESGVPRTNGVYSPTTFVHGKLFAAIPSLQTYRSADLDFRVQSKDSLNETSVAHEKLMLTALSSSTPFVQMEMYQPDSYFYQVPVQSHAWSTTNGVFLGHFGLAEPNYWQSIYYYHAVYDLTVNDQEETIFYTTNVWLQ